MRVSAKSAVCASAKWSALNAMASGCNQSAAQGWRWVVFDRGRPDEPEEGGRITSIDTNQHGSFIRFLKGSIDWKRVQPGNVLYKTSDPALEKALRQLRSRAGELQAPDRATVRGDVGSVLSISLRDEAGRLWRLNLPADRAARKQQPTRPHSSSSAASAAPPTSLSHSTTNWARYVWFGIRTEQTSPRCSRSTTALRAQPLRWKLNAPEGASDVSSKTSEVSTERPPYLIHTCAAGSSSTSQSSCPIPNSGELEIPASTLRPCTRTRSRACGWSQAHTVGCACSRAAKTSDQAAAQMRCRRLLVRNHENLRSLEGQRLRATSR